MQEKRLSSTSRKKDFNDYLKRNGETKTYAKYSFKKKAKRSYSDGSVAKQKKSNLYFISKQQNLLHFFV